MNYRKIKSIGNGIYISICLALMFSLLMMKNQINWLSVQLSEIFSFIIIGLTLGFVLIILTKFIKNKSGKLIKLGLIGIIPCILAIPFLNLPFINKNGDLSEKTETLELSYIAWACDCANWAIKNDRDKYSKNIGDSLAYNSIFIEPSTKKLELPDTLGYSNDIIKFTGKFYLERGFPEGYSSFQNPEKARVFRYTSYKVMVSNHKKYQEEFSNIE